ncbi:MAG: DUF4113 domain-containing protein, partial [Victivallales bacterium]|nr:DUF4113 domain-containing protein [Victivallales bacterium]
MNQARKRLKSPQKHFAISLFYVLVLQTGAQLDLFDALISKHSEELYAAIDNINQRFGRNTIFHLSEGVKQSWKMKRE